MDDNTKLVTLEDLQNAVPSKKGAITQEAVDIINQSLNDPEFQGESLLQTVATYERVLQGTKASISEYINAIRFCAYMVSMNDNYTEAYKKTFFNRKFVQERLNEPTGSAKYKELTSAASRYRKSKLVVDILTVSQVPMRLIYRSWGHEALGVLHDTMHTAKLDRDKINAAKELLAIVKDPENAPIELNVGVTDTSVMQSLQEKLAEMSKIQMERIQRGESINDVQKLGITGVDVIDGEVVEND